MMTAMTKTLMTAVFGIAMLGAGTGQAAPAGGAPQKEHRGIGEKMCERLSCTDAQKAELKKIRDATRPKIQAEREAMRGIKGEIAAEFRKDRLDNARLKALYGQLDARKDTIEGLRRGMMTQIHAVLTPAQREQMARAFERRGDGKHGGKRGGHGRGR